MTINSRGVNERLRVWNGSMKQTSGGLKKKDLKKNPKTGRIVSKKDLLQLRNAGTAKYAHVKKLSKRHNTSKFIIT